MRVWRAIIFTALLVLLPAQAICQPQSRGRGNGSPFFEALREAHMLSPNREILDLIREEAVRSEIALSDEDYKVLRRQMEDAMEKVRKLGEKARGENQSVEKLRDEIVKTLEPVEHSTFDSLKDKADFDRLLGLFVQHKNYSAAANSEVAKKINLSEEDLREFRETRGDTWRQIMDETRGDVNKIFQNRNGRDVRHQLEKVFEEANAQLDAALAQELSVDQKTALEKLKGAPFKDLPKRGPPPPSGGGRGFESGQPRGRGPNRDDGPKDDGPKDGDNRQKSDPGQKQECKP